MFPGIPKLLARSIAQEPLKSGLAATITKLSAMAARATAAIIVVRFISFTFFLCDVPERWSQDRSNPGNDLVSTEPERG
jgi:hypothetical protein